MAVCITTNLYVFILCYLLITSHTTSIVISCQPVQKLTNGLGGTAKVLGEGGFMWNLKDDYGVTQRVKVKAYHIPARKVRVFSPQSYFQQEKKDLLTMNVDISSSTFASSANLSFT